MTEPAPREPGGISAWQFFLLLAMLGATAAVVLSQHTHPAALLLLSAAVIAAGFVAIGLHRAFGALFSREGFVTSRPSDRDRAHLEADKALVLRSIKELEFDRAMGKVSEADFEEINARLRARALAIMEQLSASPDGAPGLQTGRAAGADEPAGLKTGRSCTACGTVNDVDARFCNQCGARLA